MQHSGGTLNATLVGLIILVFIVIAIGIVSFLSVPRTIPAPEESLTIAIGTPEPSLLTLIAQEQGLFKKYGLNVTIREYPAGAYAMKDLLNGSADLASAAEFVGVANSFQNPDLRIITTTAKIDNVFVVSRNDRGITRPSDLKGKTIAVTKGTIGEFFLGRYLLLNGVDIDTVTVRYLTPADVIESVTSGDSDAAITWDPYASRIEQMLGGNCTIWNAQSGQYYYWVTYSNMDVIRNRPDTIRNYLRALDDAESFLTTHPSEAKETLSRRMNTTDGLSDRIWKEYDYGLSLDQALIVEMEDEARWMAAQNMTEGRTAPSYHGMIVQEPMREIKPESVTIIR